MAHDIIDALRRRKRRAAHRRSFMRGEAFKNLRKNVIGTTLAALSGQMINPGTGKPIAQSTMCKWESEALGIPLWAVRKIQSIAQSARQADSK